MNNIYNMKNFMIPKHFFDHFQDCKTYMQLAKKMIEVTKKYPGKPIGGDITLKAVALYQDENDGKAMPNDENIMIKYKNKVFALEKN